MDDLAKGFIQNNNYKLVNVDIDNQICIMDAVIDKNSLNPAGIVHGGFMFGLADTTAGVLAHSLIGPSVTLNSTIDYFHPVTGNKIEANAKCIKKGSKISVFDVSIFNDKNEIVARSTITYYHLNENNKNNK